LTLVQEQIKEDKVMKKINTIEILISYLLMYKKYFMFLASFILLTFNAALSNELEIYYLKEQNSNNIKTFLQSIKYDPYDDPNFIMKLGEDILRKNLPPELIDKIENLSKTEIPALVIKGLPTDDIKHLEGDIEQKVQQKTKITESMLISFAGLMGYKLDSNPKEQKGKIIHNIYPVTGFEKTKSSKGRDPFYLHIENPFQETPPYFLILLSLEGDSTAKTTYFPLKSFLSKLPYWVIQNMKKPDFKIRSGEGLDQEETIITPLFTQDDSTGEIRVRLYQNMERITPLTTEAKTTLDFIATAFEKEEINGVSLEKGDMLIFNNGFGIGEIAGIMHGRSGYISNPNRWLQRAFLVPQNNKDRIANAEGYYRAISKILSNEVRSMMQIFSK